MKISNSSIIDTIIEYANVKFGVDLDSKDVSKQLTDLSFAQTLKIVNAVKDEDDKMFTDLIDISSVSEGWEQLPDMPEKYVERNGLEGPIMTRSGKVVYYDPKEGKYYDPDTDMYMSYDEWRGYDQPSKTDEAYGTTGTSQPSRATVRSSTGAVQNRRALIGAQDEKRDATGAQRSVAGANKAATGQGASRMPSNPDPDDVQRGQNAQAAGQAQNMASQNAAEIARLKKLSGLG
jgi:hypothetical protein